jgi:hypothetical protein
MAPRRGFRRWKRAKIHSLGSRAVGGILPCDKIDQSSRSPDVSLYTQLGGAPRHTVDDFTDGYSAVL